MKDLSKKVFHGVFWRSLERFSTQGVGLIVSIVLARLLGPEEYGTIALLSIFIAIASVLIDSGMGIALIQKKGADQLDFDSIFYFNLVVSAVLYGAMFVCAPWIASFYAKPILIPVLRWASLSLIIFGVNSVQNAILSREMKFDLSFYISLCGVFSQGIIGITMAYAGYGIWALVFSSLGSAVAATGVRWFLIGWRPSRQFSFERVASLFSFGSKMMFSGLLDTVFTQGYGLLIGRWYSPAELAFFNRGDSIPQMVMNSVQGVIGSVALPAMSSIQDDKARLRQIMKRILGVSSFLVFPCMFGLAAVAKPLVLLLLTEKWLAAVPFLQLACISYAFWPIHVANLQVIQACGRSDIFLRLESIKKIIQVFSLAVTFPFGVLSMAIGRVILAPMCVVLNSFPNKRLIGYSQCDQLMDIGPSFLAAGAMALLVYGFSFYISDPLWLLPIQLFFGVFAYLVFGLKSETGRYVRGLLIVKFLSNRQ